LPSTAATAVLLNVFEVEAVRIATAAPGVLMCPVLDSAAAEIAADCESARLPGTRNRHDRGRDPDPRRESGCALRERAEKEINHERHLARQPGVRLVTPSVADDRGESAESERDGCGDCASDPPADSAHEADQCNVRTPAAARSDPSRSRRSRSTPGNIRMPTETASAKAGSVTVPFQA
jgi:hypothetical protein